jgi:hypothetical protein
VVRPGIGFNNAVTKFPARLHFEPLRQFLVGRSDSAHHLPGVRVPKISASAKASSARAGSCGRAMLCALLCRASTADLTSLVHPKMGFRHRPPTTPDCRCAFLPLRATEHEGTKKPRQPSPFAPPIALEQCPSRRMPHGLGSTGTVESLIGLLANAKFRVPAVRRP